MFKLIILLGCWASVFTDYVAFGRVKSARLEDRKNIVGGKNVSVPHPYIHQISLRLGDRHICGGSIIHNRKVLTAAHCVYKQTTQALYVAVGITHLSEPAYYYPIKTIYVHEYYNPTGTINDIALLITQQNITFNQRVGLIKIYNSQLSDNEICTATGWGCGAYNGTITNTLQVLNTKSISKTSCSVTQNNGYPPINYTTQICVFNSVGRGLCRGDSGGPLTYNNTLVGLVSWGRNCAIGFPDVFTRVYGYKKWISSKKI